MHCHVKRTRVRSKVVREYDLVIFHLEVDVTGAIMYRDHYSIFEQYPSPFIISALFVFVLGNSKKTLYIYICMHANLVLYYEIIVV